MSINKTTESLTSLYLFLYCLEQLENGLIMPKCAMITYFILPVFVKKFKNIVEHKLFIDQ